MRFDEALLGEFFKKSEIKDGEVFKIISPEPVVQDSNQYKDKNGNPKKRYIWKAWNKGKEGSLEFNWTSIKNITEVYSGESADWVGKWVIAKNNFDMAKKKNFLYFFPVDKTTNTKLDESFVPAEGEKLTPENITWEE